MQAPNHHPNCQKPNPKVKLLFGANIIFIGIMLLFKNTGIIHWHLYNIIFSWQTLLIGLGLIFVVGNHSSITGVVLISIGGFFLLPRIFPSLPFDFSHLFWPIILIIVGIAILLKRTSKNEFKLNIETSSQNESTESSDFDYLNEIAIFGGSKHQVLNKNLKGGKITAIFGGAELDFRPAKLAEGSKLLEVNCLFGGVSMIVPQDWNVQINVVSIMGGFADKRFIPAEFNADSNKTIVIKGVAIFGGGEIKSH